MSVTRTELTRYLNDILAVNEISDYCPNGLQVEGSATIKRVVTGVTASQALIQAAIDVSADALLVHHGYFWKGESPVICGMKKQRINALLSNDINLYAYHLPLDVHAKFGNNRQLGELLNIDNISPIASIKPTGVVMQGQLSAPISHEALKQLLSNKLKRSILDEGNPEKDIHTLAWCTGGGQSFIEQAANAGVDAFITGEVSEQTIHIAREMEISFFAAGHHATERYGIKALGEHIADAFDVNVQFIDIPNPA